MVCTLFLNGLALRVELEKPIVIGPSLQVEFGFVVPCKEAQELGLESLVGAL
jgi:hypothetical protein